MQMYFFSEMIDIQLLINYGGYWEGSIYQGGYSKTTFVDRNLTYEDLLSQCMKSLVLIVIVLFIK